MFSIQVMNGVVAALKATATQEMMAEFGVSKDDYELLTRDGVWTTLEFPRVRQAIDKAQYGVLDRMGLEKIALPAEYTAAILVNIVHPINWAPAAIIVGSTTPADQLGRENGGGQHNISGSRLVSLMIRGCTEAGASVAKKKMDKGRAIV